LASLAARLAAFFSALASSSEELDEEEEEEELEPPFLALEAFLPALLVDAQQVHPRLQAQSLEHLRGNGRKRASHWVGAGPVGQRCSAVHWTVHCTLRQ
jgi:hypothetical protein